MACKRSLATTISAALSSSALFASTNWKPGTLPFDVDNNLLRLVVEIAMAYALPLFPFVLCLRHALSVSAVKFSLRSRMQPSAPKPSSSFSCPHAQCASSSLPHGSIAILCLCPIFIDIPLSASSDSRIRSLLKDSSFEIVSGWKEGVWPAELRPSCKHGATHHLESYDEVDLPDSTGKAQHKEYIKLPEPRLIFDAHGLTAREKLLAAGLAPEFRELCYLRSKTRFQNTITVLQAVGYVLTIVQRMLYQLGISPLEAILTFLCLLTIVQLAMELYASDNFTRPLLLRLTHAQLLQFLEYSDSPAFSSSPPRHGNFYSWFIQRFFLRTVSFSSHTAPRRCRRQDRYFNSIVVFMLLPILAIPIFYSLHYFHDCFRCSVSALLFTFAIPASAMGIFLFSKQQKFSVSVGIVLVCSQISFIASISVALASLLTTDWKLFSEPTEKNLFSWILPYFSS